MKTRLWILVVLVLGATARIGWAKFEQEQLAMETQLQQRIEAILSKTLPANNFLVTVKIEMQQNVSPAEIRNKTGRTAGNNPFLNNSPFVLPGVPQKKDFVPEPGTETNETVIDPFSAEALVSKISITILVAPDVTSDQIRAIRDFITASIPFNPLRGDEMDIEPSTLLQKPEAAHGRSGLFVSSATGKTNTSMIILIAAVVIALAIFVAFLFGPVRLFLNRLLAVLPRVGEQAAYAVSNSPTRSAQGNGASATAGSSNGRMNGHSNGAEENLPLPFQFIHEDQISKLPILFRQMAPRQAALVLAYLPPDWASRVLGSLDMGSQTVIMRELSQAQEVPAAVVKDVEEQVKNKLPYLVGGIEWIQSVYQLTHPETQRMLLGTLTQQSPELARTLRQQTFFFEDLTAVTAGGLRLLVQDIGYPVLAAAIKDEKPAVVEDVMRKLPAATREIIQQELELTTGDKVAIADAKIRLVTSARRLMVEGRITLPERA